MITFFNTLTRKEEEFKPITDGKVGIYTCGPTVYDYPHIGNLRAYIFSDILHRLFESRGFEVTHVINITDVGHVTGDENNTGEDKIEKSARESSRTAEEIIKKYSDAFFSDLKKLNIKSEGLIFPRATQHISEQIELIKKLQDKGFAYQISDGIYFDISKYPAYAELAKLDLDKLKAGARIEENTEKRNPGDFALWKFSKPNEKRLQEWESPWGIGFPGWHIECSAMSMKYLGEHFDIHTGGIDHIPVHHTNERAQSESATGKKLANYWLHNGFVTINSQKMSKSLKNFITISDLENQHRDPLAYRYFVLSANYRKNINFTDESIESAQYSLNKIYGHIKSMPKNFGNINDSYKKEFDEAIDDDLNTPIALSILWKLLDDKKIEPSSKKATLLYFDQILGLGLADIKALEIPPEVTALATKREQARQAGNWAEADKFRDQILALGFEVLDTNDGPKFKQNNTNT